MLMPGTRHNAAKLSHSPACDRFVMDSTLLVRMPKVSFARIKPRPRHQHSLSAPRWGGEGRVRWGTAWNPPRHLASPPPGAERNYARAAASEMCESPRAEPGVHGTASTADGWIPAFAGKRAGMRL